MFKRIIPSLLIKNNKLVKGVKFKNHRIVGNPATTAKSLGAQQSDELFAVNLDSYIDNSKQNYRIIKEITSTFMIASLIVSYIDKNGCKNLSRFAFSTSRA